ncbi:MAG TPA: NAD(P)H-binding protein [Nitrospira sp.]|nr:NAD(P)H-binding protein [Nitrospira sp.]
MAVASPARRIFLTGGTGYLGSRLIPLLVERGHHVRALARGSSQDRLPLGCESMIGDPLNGAILSEGMRGSDTVVQLVGVPKPAPWKGPQFRAVDLRSGRASIDAAKTAGLEHFVYVSVAQPAPIMNAYIDVRRECEDRLRASGLRATIIRPWYILGPGHWWPLALQPAYRMMELIPPTRDMALRLGLVSIHDMLMTLVWAVEHPPESVRVIEVPEIRRLGGAL